MALGGLAHFATALCLQSIYPFAIINNKINTFILIKAHAVEGHLLACNGGKQYV